MLNTDFEPQTFSTSMYVMGLYCNVKYEADNDGITIVNVTHINSDEQLELDFDQVTEYIVNIIESEHEEANAVDQ